MDEPHDCKTLLVKPHYSNASQSYSKEIDKHSGDDDDWWASDSGSSTGSYYSDTESSIVEWESEVGPMGDLFYIESTIESLQESHVTVNHTRNSPQPELTRRRSTRAGKLMRLIRRKESKRWSTRNKKGINNPRESSSKMHEREGTGNKEVTFRDFQAGEMRDVTLWVDPEKRHKLGRRATLCEAYFGIIPGCFSDKTRVMVAGFIPDGQAITNKNIKIGDWLRSINSTNVTLENLDNTLSKITTATNVNLQLQRVAGVDVTSEAPGRTLQQQSVLVQQLVNTAETTQLMECLLDYPLGVVYLRTTDLSDAGQELQGILYSFPHSEDRGHSFLCSTRGAFITLNHLLPSITGLQPISTTVNIAGQEIYIIYTAYDEELLLVALPQKSCSLEEAVKLSADIVRTLEFTYQSLTNCFGNKTHHSSLDHFFLLNIQRLLDIKMSVHTPTSTKHINIMEPQIVTTSTENYKFESSFSVANFIQLPRDAQIQIDAALNEMESMDYRDWNEDPMDCQRLYTILGSCIYHKRYLLGSHLAHDDLIEVHSFLRQNGLLQLVNSEPVKCLVIWKRVYPLSCNRGNICKNAYEQPLVPDGKWFLLVVGYAHDLLAVLLESGGCTAKYNDMIGPDVFYVEEAQETLKHMQKIGITTLAAKWIASNARADIITSENNIINKSTSSIAENLLGLIKSSETQTISKPTVNTSVNKKSQELASILKKRNPEESPIILGSVYSLQTSEESLSQGTGAVSEISDEAIPILGRRATREKITRARYSDDSDSDIDMYKNDSQVVAMDISNIRENLLNQAECIMPRKLTTGDKNYLYHYVQLDMVEGILLSSNFERDNLLVKDNNILLNFNKSVYVIHKLLHNTVRFKKMLNHDMDKTVINKSLIAIKEHGVLFETENTVYWVVGRLYTTPHPKELYVCYQDSAPQSLIEIAFKLI